MTTPHTIGVWFDKYRGKEPLWFAVHRKAITGAVIAFLTQFITKQGFALDAVWSEALTTGITAFFVWLIPNAKQVVAVPVVTAISPILAP